MMSHLTPYLPTLSVLGWALFHVLWQASLIALAAAVGLRLLRSASAQSRYAMLCLALLLCIALPLQYVFSHSGQDVQSWQPDLLAIQDAETSATSSSHNQVDTSDDAALLASKHVNGYWQSWEPRFASVAPILVLLWSIGVAGMALRMCAGLLWVRQRVQAGSHQSNVFWQVKLQQLAQKMAIRGEIRLGISDEIESPFTVGWWRPMVIFPTALMSGMPPELLEALLAHEVAHVKRMDYLVNLLQSAIEILLFFHPAVWWMSRQIRIEREQIADDLAAGLLGEPRRLALALSELEQFQFSHPQLAQAAHGGNLMSRIKRLIRPVTPASVWSWKTALPLLSLSAACSLIYAQAATTTHTGGALPLVFANAVSAPAASIAPAPASSDMPTSSPTSLLASSAPDIQNTKLSKSKSVSITSATGTSFALVKPGDESSYMHTDRKGTREIALLKKKAKEEFLWFSENGQSYIIKDPAILAEANAAYKPMEALGEQMEVHGKKMEEHSKVMEEIGKQMEAVSIKEHSVDDALEAKMRAFETKMDAYGRKLEAAAAKLELAKNSEERAQAHKQMKAIEVEMRDVSKKLNQDTRALQRDQEKLRVALQPLEELGQKMEQASKPMQALGEQMDQLGKQMEVLSDKAEKQVKDLIQNAKQKGLALPTKDI